MFAGAIWPWIGFNLFVLVMLAIDLGVFHRKAHAVSLKEASIWSIVWITLALAFNAGLYFLRGPDPALQFFTGWLLEKSLSVDNIFIFVLLFSYFSVPPAYQHRVLFWGILGALITRGTLIGVGSVLLEQFHWIIYLFGAFLIFSGIRMALHKETDLHLEKNPLLKFVRRVVPVTEDYERDRFIIQRAGKLMVTPLLLVLLVVESTDVVFAVLGLRSLYFIFANIIDKFYYLKLGLSVILTYVGVKMLVEGIFHVPTFLSLVVIAFVLIAAIAASVVRARRQAEKSAVPEEQPSSSL